MTWKLDAYAHLNEIKPPRAQKALAEHYDLAQMSKELATICIDCPVEFSYADMEVGNLYTQEAYEYMMTWKLDATSGAAM